VGAVIGPIVGAGGTPGVADIMIFADGREMHPAELVTVKVYVPSLRLVTVVLEPEPDIETLPGERISVQEPVDGNPVRITLPLEMAHVGWVTVPITGAPGITG
jgi:hypothetical protein